MTDFSQQSCTVTIFNQIWIQIGMPTWHTGCKLKPNSRAEGTQTKISELNQHLFNTVETVLCLFIVDMLDSAALSVRKSLYSHVYCCTSDPGQRGTPI